MTQTTHPTKEQVREFMRRPKVAKQPLPTLEEVQRQLGWRLIEAEREAKQPR